MWQLRSSSKSLHLSFVVTIVFIGYLVVIAAMARWQVFEHDRLDALAKEMIIATEEVYSFRGNIYARDGSILSMDEPVWTVYVSVSNYENDRQLFQAQYNEMIDTLSSTLGISKDELEDKINENPYYAVLSDDVSDILKNELAQHNFVGLHFKKHFKRVYPNGKLAANVLGFVSQDETGNYVGRYGVTGFYWGAIEGTNGFMYEERDLHGNVIMASDFDPMDAKEGKEITLTIDPIMQRVVEEKLKEGVIEMGAKSGVAIVMNPKTGEILAMASYPTYDPNAYWEVKSVDWYRNRAVADAYEYGSVNKVLTISTAIELGKIDENYICHDNTGYIKVADRTIYTWDRMPDGDLKPEDILAKSNNVCAATVALILTSKEFHDSLQKFGIGELVNIGLEDEASGYLLPVDQITDINQATMAFGQTLSATPLQIISAISAIANNGCRMQPYIIQKIDDVEVKPQVITCPVSKDTAGKVAKMMRKVVTDGDARYFFRDLQQYNIAGKTGTAQIPKENEIGYKEDKTNVTFVGFGPYENPKFIMIVRLEEPTKDIYSATTVVPVWVNIFKAILPLLEL